MKTIAARDQGRSRSPRDELGKVKLGLKICSATWLGRVARIGHLNGGKYVRKVQIVDDPE